MFFMIFIAILSCHGIDYASYLNNSNVDYGSHTPSQQKLPRLTCLNVSLIEADTESPLTQPNSLRGSSIDSNLLEHRGYPSVDNRATSIAIQPDESSPEINELPLDPDTKKVLIASYCFILTVAATIPTWMLIAATT